MSIWFAAMCAGPACGVRATSAPSIQGYLAMLANVRHVAAGTHGQAMSAPLFLNREFFGIDVPWTEALGRPVLQAGPDIHTVHSLLGHATSTRP